MLPLYITRQLKTIDGVAAVAIVELLQMKKLCVIGAGRMGSALARVLLKRGYQTSVWNRTAEKALALRSLGAQTPDSLGDAIAVSDVVLVNVLDYAASDNLLRAPAITGALRSKLVVQLTSGSPQLAREAAGWAADHGIDYLDGAIMATPNFIGETGGTILYSGPRRLFDDNIDIFAALTGNALHVGEDFGHASALDVALLTQMWGKLFGTLQAIAVSEAEGIDSGTLARYLPTFRPTVEGAVEDLLARVQAGRYRGDADTLASVAAHYGAFQHLLEITRERNLNPAVPQAFECIFKAGIAKGYLHHDFASLLLLMRHV